MKLELFDYTLPPERIATQPYTRRDQAKLLVAQPTSTQSINLQTTSFAQLAQHLPNESCVFVINDSQVVPARLLGKKNGGGHMEALLLQPGKWQAHSNDTWSQQVLLGNVKNKNVQQKISAFLPWPHLSTEQKVKLLQANGFFFGNDLWAFPVAQDLNDPHHPKTILAFTLLSKLSENNKAICNSDLQKTVNQTAYVPLPPYMNRPQPYREQAGPDVYSFEKLDREYYQTVFAQQPGSVAAPTAGMHFTPELMSQLQQIGHQFIAVTLHVGMGTFEPIKVSEIEDHVIHQETILLSPEAQNSLAQAYQQNKIIIPVGTTSLRTLESWAADPAIWTELQNKNSCFTQNYSADTQLYITPGYKPRLAQALITNFHQPKSSLLVLVASLLGLESTQKAYQYALEHNFQFLSYGDAMLIKSFLTPPSLLTSK